MQLNFLFRGPRPFLITSSINTPIMPNYGEWGGRLDLKLTYFNDAEDKAGNKTSGRATVWCCRSHF